MTLRKMFIIKYFFNDLQIKLPNDFEGSERQRRGRGEIGEGLENRRIRKIHTCSAGDPPKISLITANGFEDNLTSKELIPGATALTPLASFPSPPNTLSPGT